MKLITPICFVFIVAFLFLMPSSISAQSALTEVDLRIKGIGQNSEYRQIVNTLGKPLRVKTVNLPADQACSDERERHRTLIYNGLELVLLRIGGGREGVTAIKVTSSKWETSGIRIGEDMAAVISHFGVPNSRDIRDGRTILFYVTPGNLGSVKFEFKNEELVGIFMSETLC
jgi:hypothetical protein